MAQHKSDKAPHGALTRLPGMACQVVWWPAVLLLGALAAASLLMNGMFPATYEEYVTQHFALHITLPLFAVFLLALALLQRAGARMPAQALYAAIFVYPLAFGVWWVLAVRETPVDDAAHVLAAAQGFIAGDYSALQPAGYIGMIPYQLGLAAYEELVLRLAGPQNHLALQLLNALYTALTYTLVLKMTALLFPGDDDTLLTAFLLLATFLPPLFYATFVYGNVPGLLCALLAVYFTLKILRSVGNMVFNLVFILFFSILAVLFKSNSIIFVIAMVLVLLVHAAAANRWHLVAFVVALALATAFAQTPLNALYATRSGITLDKGAPKALNLVLGLTENERGPGWYDETLVITYVAAGYSHDKAEPMARDMLRTRLAEMAASPGESASFFSKKILSQWNEPSFAALWLSHHYGQHEKQLGRFATSMYTGRLRVALYAEMGFSHFALLAGGFVFLLACRRRADLAALLPMAIFLGGFFFYLVWEAKSQYILPYFVVLLPCAAVGLSGAARRLAGALPPRRPAAAR